MPSFLFRFFRLAVLIASGLAVASLPAAPLITEFMASNASGLKDEDGALPDWIEVHNPDATPVNLLGWSLTDDPNRPARWSFPAVTLDPGAYLVVFASGKDRAVSGAPLHTNFSLSAGGEYLALFPPGSMVPAAEFAPAYPAQSADVSYGLLGTDPGAERAYFPLPTPGAANVSTTAPAEAVRFSIGSRTFQAGAPLSLTLSTLSPTATIRYTTNRSEPGAASTQYTGPISVSGSIRIRARAFEPGRPAGPVVSETYLLIDAAAAAFSSPLPVVLTHTFGAGSLPNDVPVAASIMVFAPSAADNLARLTDLPVVAGPVSLERRGSTTASALKHSMTLELWDETNADRDLPMLGLPADSDWVLHAPYEFDRSLMHNDLIYRLSNEAGRYAPRTRFVEHLHSTVDGVVNGAVTGSDYFGVYSLQERIKRGGQRVDIEKLTPADNAAPAVQGGYLLKVDRTGTDTGLAAGGYTNGTGTVGLVWVDPKESSGIPEQVVSAAQKAWVTNDLNAMWAAMNAPSFMDPVNGYARYLEVVPTVDNHILNTAARNLDALRLSAYWYKPRFGKWTAGPLWDFDRAMGSTDVRENGPLTWAAAPSGGDFGTDFFHYKWYNEMFRDPNFWQQWVDRLDVLRTSALSTQHVMEVIDELAAQLASGGSSGTPAGRNFQKWSAMPPRPAASATPGTNGTWAGEIAWLKSWWTQRLAFMDGQFTRPVTADLTPGVVPAGSLAALASSGTVSPGVQIYYTLDGTDPRPLATEPYPAAGVQTVTPFMPETSAVRALVPASDPGTAWRGEDLNHNNNHADDFDDSAWRANAPGALNGVGYDDATTAGQVSFLTALGVRLNSPLNPVAPSTPENTMLGNRTSCYLRMPFDLTPAQLASVTAPASLVLQIRSDDGFVAFLNGVEVARDRAPEVLAWDEKATGARADTDALAWTSYPVSQFASLLKAGTNLIAIHGLNSSLTSNDALYAARLVLMTPPAPYQPPLSPSALLYQNPVPVNGPVVITARALNPVLPSDPPTKSGGGTGVVPNGTGWSAPRRMVYLPDAVPASAANLSLTEIHYHPSPPTGAELAAGFLQANDFEFIRITNHGNVPLNLTGIRFSAGVQFTMPLDLTSWLAPGQSAVVVENTAAYHFRYGSPWPVLGEFSGALDDGGESLILVDRDSLVIAEVTYDDALPWPAAADSGKSLVLTGSNPAMPQSWQASLDEGGTGVSSFASFQARYFPGGGSGTGLEADPDGDGLNNFAEFVMGTDPRRSGGMSAVPLEITSTQPFTLRARRRTGLTRTSWGLEAAGALVGWQAIGSPPVVTPLTPELEQLEWILPEPAGPRFFRLKVAVDP